MQDTRGVLPPEAPAADTRTTAHPSQQLMARGEHLNVTEDRAVAHMALRAPTGIAMPVDGEDVVPAVHEVLDRVAAFSEAVRDGKHTGVTGKTLNSVIAIGIGGSYLGPEFVAEALRHDPDGYAAAAGRNLHFLANVDPVDFARAVEGFDPERTLVIVVSKTFTTAETMLNARTVKAWLTQALGTDPAVTAKHMIAVSANVPGAVDFGIAEDNVFGFWDWVGGRYSVCSAVGVVPLALQYGMPLVRQFLAGAHACDQHFIHTPLEQNMPVVLGLLGVWNSTFMGHSSRALLPYSQALHRFAAHVQQVDMESNGKRVTVDGSVLPFQAGEVDFGEPGTNGQHSFYQLLHQGRVVPADFIGACESQHPVQGEGEPVSNHDELMSNFFAQPDALALGRTAEELTAAGVSKELISAKTFPGNRPSTSILLPRVDAFYVGWLLALYEHRTAVQGFVWNVPSFDQWGVELGKTLAKTVRDTLGKARRAGGAAAVDEAGYNTATASLLKAYLAHSPAK